MHQSLENRTRERAYATWTAHGCIHGQADEQAIEAILLLSCPRM